jgi:hypothetical protein
MGFLGSNTRELFNSMVMFPPPAGAPPKPPGLGGAGNLEYVFTARTSTLIGKERTLTVYDLSG